MKNKKPLIGIFCLLLLFIAVACNNTYDPGPTGNVVRDPDYNDNTEVVINADDDDDTTIINTQVNVTNTNSLPTSSRVNTVTTSSNTTTTTVYMANGADLYRPTGRLSNQMSEEEYQAYIAAKADASN